MIPGLESPSDAQRIKRFISDVSEAMETTFLPNQLMRDHKSLYGKLWLGTKPWSGSAGELGCMDRGS